ncbi:MULTISPECIES: thiamine phosphate synthase [Micrococcus]|uniref:Thiamine-phosphate synthase n=1 Tax=Micrococcus yunnanensis TaxID=566027 RepID=A0AAP5T9F6_9MICC|nr:thiamine phosphate synthase [Micrococcus yunnanensis]MDV7178000.1 thiamine phosphate synthase [Micrococcus yunnanensis]WHM17399.1 thiamine phosphate synthase [Micrococcus yunnanensis]
MKLGLYVITDRDICGARGVAETVRRAVRGGARIVQLRDKKAGFDDQLRQVEELAEAIDGRARLIVNDRLDVAIAARDRGILVDGVHLGQGDARALTARQALGRHAIVGLTANTSAHLAAVSQLPAGTVDYLGVGVIRPTTTKPDHPPALGVDGFAELVANTQIPCVAIGGITLADVAPLKRAGAAGIAVVSAVCAAADPESAARTLTREWER